MATSKPSAKNVAAGNLQGILPQPPASGLVLGQQGVMPGPAVDQAQVADGIMGTFGPDSGAVGAGWRQDVLLPPLPVPPVTNAGLERQGTMAGPPADKSKVPGQQGVLAQPSASFTTAVGSTPGVAPTPQVRKRGFGIPGR